MQVVPISGALGAEVRGVDLRTADADEVESVLDVLHRYEVIFFREARLSPDEHMAAAKALGEVNLYPIARLMGKAEPTFQEIVDGPESPPEADDWHTDVTWTAEPPRYALLHAEVVPERGGDTLWASMTTAFDALSSRMQQLVLGLEVVHDCTSFIAGMRRKMHGMGVTDEAIEEMVVKVREGYPPVTHPLVRTHPDTGRQALFLGGRFMRSVVGLHDDESRFLLDFLGRHIQDPRFHCRWRWTSGDLAIWDERSTNHRSAADHFPQARSLRRVEIVGDRPYFDAA